MVKQDIKAAYRKRDDILVGMGFASYKKYLASELWENIRQRVLERDEHKCYGCGNQAKQVHHKQYTAEALCGDDIRNLISTCGRCHRIAEFGKNGKVALKNANSRFKTIHRRNAKSKLKDNQEYRRLYARKRVLLQKPRELAAEELKQVRKKLREMINQAI